MMRQSFFSKFSRSNGYAPNGWPEEDVLEIDASANELRKITSDFIKKLSVCVISNNFPLLRSVDLSPYIPGSKKQTDAPKEPQDKVLMKRDDGSYKTSKIIHQPGSTHSEPNGFNSSLSEGKIQDFNSAQVGITSSSDFSDSKDISKPNDLSEPRFFRNGPTLRIKKMPETMLARTCLEASERLSHLQPTLSHLLFGCGQASTQLAQARLDWGSRVHDNVIARMKRVSESTRSNSEMARARRLAWRAGGELRSVSERAARAANSLANAQGQSYDERQSPDGSESTRSVENPLFTSIRRGTNQSPRSISKGSTPQSYTSPSSPLCNPLKGSGINPVSPTGDGVLIKQAKVTQLNAIKEDLETESQLLKEKALKELFNFETASTQECSQALIQMVEISAAYHRQCAAILEDLLPLLKSELEDQCPLPVYGRELTTHLAVTHARIAYPLRRCIRVLSEPAAMCEEGIFRIAGSKTKVDTLKSALNSLRADRVMGQYDAYVVADALKQYLRSLPQPLLTTHLLSEWSRALLIQDKGLLVRRLHQIACQMPPDYERNAGFLFRYLNRLIEHSESNRMTAANLAIIFGPSLLISSVNSESSREISCDNDAKLAQLNGPPQLAFQGAYKGLIETLIIHANEIFSRHPDGDVEDDFDCVNSGESEIEEMDECGIVTHTSLSLASEPITGSTPSRQMTRGDAINRRAQRAMSEFVRQSRAIRNLPQRLRSRHSKTPVATVIHSEPRPIRVGGSGSDVNNSNVGSCTNHLQEDISSPPIGGHRGLDLEAAMSLEGARSLTSEETASTEDPENEVHSVSAETKRSTMQTPRSILQRQHMEWRRAMLEVAESTSATNQCKSSIHGDLYDTIFTLQTLNNSKTGVEELLARVRSVYETRGGLPRAANTAPPTKTKRVADPPGEPSNSRPLVSRRHSTSSLTILGQNKPQTSAINFVIGTVSSFQNPRQAAAVNYRKKCSTNPGPINGRMVQPIAALPLVNDSSNKKYTTSTACNKRYSVCGNETRNFNSNRMQSMGSFSNMRTKLNLPSKRTTLPLVDAIGLDATPLENQKIEPSISHKESNILLSNTSLDIN